MNADASNVSVENWRGTKLFGWKGCDKYERRIIIETMKDFHTLANQEALWKEIGTLFRVAFVFSGCFNGSMSWHGS